MSYFFINNSIACLTVINLLNSINYNKCLTIPQGTNTAILPTSTDVVKTLFFFVILHILLVVARGPAIKLFEHVANPIILL